jgi:hypothetical protein
MAPPDLPLPDAGTPAIDRGPSRAKFEHAPSYVLAARLQTIDSKRKPVMHRPGFPIVGDPATRRPPLLWSSRVPKVREHRRAAEATASSCERKPGIEPKLIP